MNTAALLAISSVAVSLVALPGCHEDAGAPPAPDETGTFAAAMSGEEVWTRLARTNDPDCFAAPQELDCDAKGSCVVGGVIQSRSRPRSSPCVLRFGRAQSVQAADTDSLYLARYDAAGTPLWAVTFGEASTVLHGVAVGPRAVYAACSDPTEDATLFSTASIHSFDLSTGRPWWRKAAGTTGAHRFTAITVDRVGDVLVAGEIDGTADYGGGSLAARGGLAVVKYHPAGHYRWSHVFSSQPSMSVPGAIHPKSITTTTPFGRVYVAGTFHGETALDGNPVVGKGHVFVLARESDGQPLWRRTFGPPGQAPDRNEVGIFRVTAVRPAGNDVVLGGTHGEPLQLGSFGLAVKASRTDLWSLDVFVTKLSGDTGEPRWARGFGGPKTQMLTGLATSNDAIALTVDFAGSIDFGLGRRAAAGSTDGASPDVALAKLDWDGVPLWDRHLYPTPADSGGIHAVGVDLDAQNNGFVLGMFSSAVDFGSGPVESPEALFLTKLQP